MRYYIPAKVKGRPRLGRRGRVFTPKDTIEFERKVRQGWRHKPLDGPVAVQIIVGNNWFDVNVWPIKRGLRPARMRGDLDNYCKSILDGLNGAAFMDDRQVHYIDISFSQRSSDENEK